MFINFNMLTFSVFTMIMSTIPPPIKGFSLQSYNTILVVTINCNWFIETGLDYLLNIRGCKRR